MVDSAVRPAVSPTVPPPISSADAQSSVRRPRTCSSLVDRTPATVLPAANAVT